MAKKKYTWKLEEEIIKELQKKAAKEHRSLTNYIEVLLHKDNKRTESDVVNRREQLILFAQFVQNDYYGNGIENAEIIVDRWLNREKN